VWQDSQGGQLIEKLEHRSGVSRQWWSVQGRAGCIDYQQGQVLGLACYLGWCWSEWLGCGLSVAGSCEWWCVALGGQVLLAVA